MSKRTSLFLLITLLIVFVTFSISSISSNPMIKPFVNSITMPASKPITNDWLCIPGERVGPITADSTEEQLKQFFGDKNVQRERRRIAEGPVFANTTLIFKGTKNEILIQWKDDQSLKNPSVVSIYKEGTSWKMPEGITVGTSLAELNQINEKEFFIRGFRWEFGGFIKSWGEGKLSKYKDRSFAIQLQTPLIKNLPRRFIGDGNNFSSEEELLSNANMTVDLIKIYFE